MITTIPDRHFAIQYGLDPIEQSKISHKIVDRHPKTTVGNNIALSSPNNLKKRHIRTILNLKTKSKHPMPILIAQKNDIGILGISTSITDKSIQNKINKTFSKHYQSWNAIIIDVRGNPGGDSRTTDMVAKQLYGNPPPYAKTIKWRNTPEAKYIHQRNIDIGYKNPKDRKFEYDRLDRIYRENSKKKMINRVRGIYPFNSQRGFTKPIYILIDRKTASSGEGLITQLRANPHVVVIGENSGGVCQYGNIGIVALPNDTMFRLGSDYRTFKEGNIEGIGYTPDINCTGNDAFQVAFKLLQKALVHHNKL